MGIREGRWLCQHCGSENLGRYEDCRGLDGHSGCNAARGPKQKFYLPENSPIVTDPNQLADAGSGQDWNCDHCSGANKNAYDGHKVLNCVHCGNARDAQDTTHPVTDYAPDEVPRSAAAVASPRLRNKPRPTTQLRPSLTTISTVTPKMWPWWGAGIALVAAVVFGVWYFIFASFDVSAHVDEFSWERTISIEQYQTVTEEDWSIPVRGREVGQDVRIRSYNHVLDHYDTKTRQVSEQVQSGSETYNCGTRDLGNGYFQDLTCSRPTYTTQYRTESYQDPVYRDDPVYDTWYTYHIEKWVPDRTRRAVGSDQKPYWPDYHLANVKERVSAETEKYLVLFKDTENRMYTKALELTDWQGLHPGQSVTITTNRFGTVLKYTLH